jgi:hypothetical protein
MPVLQIRLTDEQMDRLRGEAEKAGEEKVSSWARDVLLGPRPFSAVESLSPEVESFVAERRRHQGLGRMEYIERVMGSVRENFKLNQADPGRALRIRSAMVPVVRKIEPRPKASRK